VAPQCNAGFTKVGALFNINVGASRGSYFFIPVTFRCLTIALKLGSVQNINTLWTSARFCVFWRVFWIRQPVEKLGTIFRTGTVDNQMKKYFSERGPPNLWMPCSR